MKRIILLYFCIILIPAFSVEKKALFISGDDLPFHQFSAKGDFSILPSDELWPEVLQIVSSGDGSNVQIVAQNLPEFSLKDLNQVLWLKVENLKELKDLWFYASDSSDFSNRIVFMVSRDSSQLREGEWCRVSLPLSSGQIWGNPDLSKLTSYQIWMNDRGGSPVTLQMGPVFLEESLPPSALVFSFDDGWKTQISAAAPLMSQYGLKGTAYIIPALIDTPGYMDLDDLKRLINDYGWSVGSHYLEPINNFDSAEVRSLFEKQRQWFENAGISMNDFSYPNGMHDQELLTIVPDYFRTGRTIIEFPESLPPGNPYKLRMLNVIPSTSLDVIENRIQTMADRGELLILVFHKIESVSQFETELTVERFEEICRIAARSGRENLNMESVYPRFQNRPDSDPLLLSSGSVFQPSSYQGSPEKKILPSSPVSADPLAVSGPGRPGLAEGTQIDFSLDWRMVWGTLDTDTADAEKGDPQFYNQLDDLHLYLQSELSDSARLFTVAGIEEVNFEDFSKGSIDGSYFYLNSLFLEQDLPADFQVQAGYHSPDPVHKWLQVTRSAGIESALGQDMTPQSLWIGGKWTGKNGFGIQGAAVPDLIGVESGSTDIRQITYQKDLGVPNLFSSFWYDSKNWDAELAASVNGDAFKIASSGGYTYDFKPMKAAASVGIKYTKGDDFTTYPLWDHLDKALRLSAGISLNMPVLSFDFNPGLAYQTIYYDDSVRHEMGVDAGILYKALEVFLVLTDYDLSRTVWSDTLGLETGVTLDYSGVEYTAGYTMAGFNTISGLYNNKEWNEGGVNGLFLRIKATYW